MPEQKVDIQKKIEDIDTKLYKLLMQRAELVKENPYPVRIENLLGQEAKGIRRMLKYHTGDFPEYVVAKIWREILSASANMKEKLKIAVYGDEKDGSILHQVQEHFGSYVSITILSSYSQVFNLVSTREADIAIIPSDNNEMNDQPWWNALSADKNKESLNIVAKLPFIRSANITQENEAYVLALLPSDASGIDNSLFAVETEINVSHSTITETFNTLGFAEAKLVMSVNKEDTKYSLVEVKGFCIAEEIQKLEIPEVFKNLHLAGTYAQPIILS